MAVSSPSQGPPFHATGLSPLPSHRRGNRIERRDYRLIDARQQPHPQLDGLYESVEEAMADAIGWLESMGPGAGETSIGLEVSTPCGSWRTIRQPDLLLCPLPFQAQIHSAAPAPAPAPASGRIVPALVLATEGLLAQD